MRVNPIHSPVLTESPKTVMPRMKMTVGVAYCSTPAQYFHLLRRQALRTSRRPLICMQPKSLLRLPQAASTLDDLSQGGFMPVIDDPIASQHRDDVRRLVFCTGKLYYDMSLAATRSTRLLPRVTLSPG
jgi:2-oxoglutarate dehydrogenase E1 component